MASLWRKALRGAVRGAGRTTGRVLSRHVLPDTVIPSWKTQQRASSITSGIWGFGSRLVKKTAKKVAKSREAKRQAYPQTLPPSRPNYPARGVRPPAPDWQVQAGLSRAKLVELDRRKAEAVRLSPYRSAALSRVMRPSSAPSSPRPAASRAVAARPAPFTARPKAKAREYVDTDSGEIFSTPGPGRTWADAPAPARRSNPNSWARGATLKPRAEEEKPAIKPARAYYSGGPASVRMAKKRRQTFTNSYNGLAQRPSKFAY